MDDIFALAAVPRARVLERVAARVPGCLYVCLWAPVIAGFPSNHLFCLDAWIGNGGGGGGGGGRAWATFEAYRGALCAVVSGCVPGWAYMEGRAYMELPEPDLTASASLQVQQQLYHEAGTKTAVFMGCESGEIEVGLSTTSAATGVADHVQQSLLEELLQLPPTRPSSSSSSLPSLSVGSPEYTSLIRSMATSVAVAAAEPSTRTPQPAPMLASPLHGLLAPVYGSHEFLSADADDAAMAQAMLAVISSPDPSSTSAPPRPPSPPWLARHRAQRTSPRRATAFKAYNAALSPRAWPRPGAPGQRMIKTGISLLVSLHMAMHNLELAAAHHEEGAAPPPPPPPPTSSQLHHMISERRRRERLNDSFQALRALLPPGSKKDKANVLANTTEYMNKLIAQVSDLQGKNRQLEARLSLQPGESQTASDDSSERIHVDVTTSASTSASTPDQPREVSIRVTVRADCDVSDLVIALLARLKEMGRFAVVSVDARQRSSALEQGSLTLRVTAGDVLDEASLKEAVTKVVEDALMTPPAPPPESP